MKRRPRTALVAVAAVGMLGACGDPSSRTVARDIVDGLANTDQLTDVQRDCLLEQLELTPDDELKAVAEGGRDIDFSTPNALEQTSDQFQAFVERLRSTCMEAQG